MKTDSHMPMVEALTERELEIINLISGGLSNRQIADQLVLSHGTVKWYNKQIYRKLGVHNRTHAVAQAKKAGLFDSEPEPPTRTDKVPVHNLPAQVTSFIGRADEIQEIKDLLRTVRLLTLTGPGGSGKTRLALLTASDVLERFKDGVFFVNLAPIRDTNLLLSTIIRALGLREVPGQSLIESLKRNLHEKQLLLLLDNFEQIIEAAPQVAELLSSSPGLRVLVTSREALQIYGEQEYPVHPLSIPDLSRPESSQVLSQYESTELFYQRAKAVKPDFMITPENGPSIAEICVRLDGLPLAIELAAARSKFYSPEMIRSRLSNRLTTLSSGSRDVPARLQTLRGTLDWSYDLLDIGEQKLFERLSVFQGGRTVESTDAVCGPGLEIDVLDGLESLLNKNLLYQEQDSAGEPRFYLLETVHEYGCEKLEESGEVEVLKRRHAEYFANLAAQAENELFRDGQANWIERLRTEQDNLRAALNWSLDCADVVLGSQIVGALREFWYSEGFISEGLRWTEKAIACDEDLPKNIRAKVINTAGHLYFAQGDYEGGKQFSRQALALSQGFGADLNRAEALIILAANMGAFPGEVKEGIGLCEEGLTLFRDLENIPGITHALNVLGELARMDGDYERAQEVYEECLAISRQTGDKHRAAVILSNLSYVAMHKGDFKLAEAYLLETLSIMWKFNYKYMLGLGLAILTGPVAANGHPERATRLFGASEGILLSIGAALQPADNLEVDQYLADIRAQLDEKTFESAWAEGRAMSIESAVAYALNKETDQ